MGAMNYQHGIDRLLDDPEKLATLRRARVGLVAHPGSVTGNHQHTVDALIAAGCNVLRAFGPQHGYARGQAGQHD